jgi:hypothetical protein
MPDLQKNYFLIKHEIIELIIKKIRENDGDKELSDALVKLSTVIHLTTP